MNIKKCLIWMTLIAVVSDTLLHPFYPQYFQSAFAVNDPEHVGYYFSMVCFMVMISFPMWAFIAQKREELSILVFTQLMAGLLATACFMTTSYFLFWVLSLLMIFFKGSYLLVYPYILKLDDKKNHTQTIGLLAVVVHFGSIAGAIIGGLVIDSIDPKYIFLIMAAGDFLQMMVSRFLLSISDGSDHYKREKMTFVRNHRMQHGFIVKLGITNFLFYFSSYIINPFFSRYWESISDYDSKLISGLVYAIPGLVAIAVMFYRKYKKSEANHPYHIITALVVAMIAMVFQASKIDLLVLLSRFGYGWASFQAVVYLDALLFDLSSESSYATDYSKIHFFQNAGVLVSSFSAGILVDQVGLHIPFIAAFLILAATACTYYFFFHYKFKTQLN